ncbi:prohibitin family protein [Salmonella enterica]|nr:prohibitin family protein [Salmonella enterica subsp. enterica serovar Saintpaul]EEC1302886.1 prohibitin family protein [Salmonella enterica]
MNIKAGASLGGVAVVALVGLSVVFGSWYTIDQTERGVVLRNGRIVDVADPGLHFKWPFVESVEKISTQVHKASYKQVTAYSKDQQPATITISVNYAVPPGNVAEVYASSKNLDSLVGRILDPQVPEKAENTFGQFTAVSVVQKRADFVKAFTENVRVALKDVKSPLFIESVNVENIDFSKAYEDSVEKQMQAEVAIATRRQNLETEKVNAEIERTKQQGIADGLLAKAKANADAIKLKGDAEAAALEAKAKAIASNPQLVAMMAVEKWDGELPKQQVPGSAVPFVNLPTPQQRVQ